MMRWKFNWRKWCDEFVLAGKGIMLATREKRFWTGFLPAFVVFGMLINLLSGGFSKFDLMFALPFPQGLKIIGDALVGVVGINMVFTDWIFMFFIALLQGMLIGLIVLLWNKKRVGGKRHDNMDGAASNNSANVEKAGIITGLIALGAGCPTCGTTLLTPLLGAIFSTGSFAVAGIISGVVTAVAIIIAILSLKKLGVETYVVIVNEKYLLKKKQEV